VGANANRVFVGAAVGAVAVCAAVGVSLMMGDAVAVGVGNSSGNVGGIWVGVEGGGNVSASDNKMPPTTRMTETIAMMTPMPNWRMNCMITSPFQ
jgi:hypothetical protein